MSVQAHRPFAFLLPRRRATPRAHVRCARSCSSPLCDPQAHLSIIEYDHSALAAPLHLPPSTRPSRNALLCRGPPPPRCSGTRRAWRTPRCRCRCGSRPLATCPCSSCDGKEGEEWESTLARWELEECEEVPALFWGVLAVKSTLQHTRTHAHIHTASPSWQPLQQDGECRARGHRAVQHHHQVSTTAVCATSALRCAHCSKPAGPASFSLGGGRRHAEGMRPCVCMARLHLSTPASQAPGLRELMHPAPFNTAGPRTRLST